jgi:hypothetical protein
MAVDVAQYAHSSNTTIRNGIAVTNVSRTGSYTATDPPIPVEHDTIAQLETKWTARFEIPIVAVDDVVP